MFQEQTGRRNQNRVLKVLSFWLVTAKARKKLKSSLKKQSFRMVLTLGSREAILPKMKEILFSLSQKILSVR